MAVSREEAGTPVAPAELMAAGGRVLAFLNREEQARREVATSMLDLAGDWWAARDDDEVFAGHAIQASFNPQGILTDTDIPG